MKSSSINGWNSIGQRSNILLKSSTEKFLKQKKNKFHLDHRCKNFFSLQILNWSARKTKVSSDWSQEMTLIGRTRSFFFLFVLNLLVCLKVIWQKHLVKRRIMLNPIGFCFLATYSMKVCQQMTMNFNDISNDSIRYFNMKNKNKNVLSYRVTMMSEANTTEINSRFYGNVFATISAIQLHFSNINLSNILK